MTQKPFIDYVNVFIKAGDGGLGHRGGIGRHGAGLRLGGGAGRIGAAGATDMWTGYRRGLRSQGFHRRQHFGGVTIGFDLAPFPS